MDRRRFLQHTAAAGHGSLFAIAINWYDLVDPYSFIDNGSLLANPDGEPKAAYHRLDRLEREWGLI